MRFAAADLSGNFLCAEQLADPSGKGRAGRRPRAEARPDGSARARRRRQTFASSASRCRALSMSRQGVVLETDNVFGWRDRATDGANSSNEFDLPVRIDNDVNMAALAELSAGSAPDNFVFIRLHTGIGCRRRTWRRTASWRALGCRRDRPHAARCPGAGLRRRIRAAIWNPLSDRIACGNAFGNSLAGVGELRAEQQVAARRRAASGQRDRKHRVGVRSGGDHPARRTFRASAR